MKIIERWREHRGSVDERVEAESNRVYKLGFVMLSFGVLVYLYYDWSLKQAMCMRDVLANGAGRMEFTSADLFLYGWFALTMIPLFLLGFWVAFKSAQSRRRQLDMRLGE